MTIKLKLILIGILVFIGITGITSGSQYALKHTADFQHIDQQLSIVEKDFFLLKKDEQSFRITKNMEHKERFLRDYKLTHDELNLLIEELNHFGIDNALGLELQNRLKQYSEHFEAIVAVQQKIGLNPEDGFYGAMRDAVHQVENIIKQQNDDLLLARMLELRRNEKDFMLRHDLQNIKLFENNLALFHSDLTYSTLPEAVKNSLQDKMQIYENNIHALIANMKTKGLGIDQGLQKELQDSADSVHKILDDLAHATHAIVTKEIKKTNIMIQVFSIAIILLVSFALYWITRQIVSSLGSLSKLIESATSTLDLSLRHPAKHRDEIGKTGQAFNRMMEQFQLVIKEVNMASDELYASTKQLSSSASESNSSIQAQQQQTEQLAVAMDEMTESVNSIATNTRACADTAVASRDRCAKGHSVVEAAADSIQLLSDKIDNANSSIQRLQQDSNSIGSVLEVIRDIAEQTNLLALNAAIEAARAGEQGRGFAVVADEVRTLAGRTQKSTTEIQEIIESLQRLSNEAVLATTESLEQTKIGVEHVLQTGTSLTEIVNDVTNMTDMNAEIAAVTEQQKIVALEVCKSANVIKVEADQAANQSHITAGASQELSTLAAQLHALSAKFKI